MTDVRTFLRTDKGKTTCPSPLRVGGIKKKKEYSFLHIHHGVFVLFGALGEESSSIDRGRRGYTCKYIAGNDSLSLIEID